MINDVSIREVIMILLWATAGEHGGVNDGTDIDWKYDKLPENLYTTMHKAKVIERMRFWFPRYEKPKDGLLSRAQLLEIIGPENESLLEEVALELEMLNL
jgi:hypothetical protein